MSNTRTITLTGRPPVTINEENWPMFASASDKSHDGQIECQANRMTRWFIGVRKHKDGRAIVNATYSYTSNWQGARDYSAKRGVLLDGSPDVSQIIDAIHEVANEIAEAEHNSEEHIARWPTLVAEVIADMPAENLE